MAIDKGDIYWVTLVGQGNAINGRRPCVVMSRRAVNDAVQTVVLVPLTTTDGPHPAFRIRIPAGQMVKEVTCTSTLKDSIAKCDQVCVMDQKFLETKIGRLTQTAIAAVELGITYVFDFR